MKKTITLLSALLIANFYGQAQTFTDNFESYNVGATLGPQSPNWTTWSNLDGGSEDVNVVNSDAKSGTKSIYFTSTSATGGPSDVVLPFGGVYTSGTFEFKANFKVPAAKVGYFNFQATAVMGETWTLETYFNADQTLTIGNTSAALLASTYPQGQWFELKIVVNLNANHWEVFVDSVSKGTFTNPINQVSAIDIYPPNANTSFWVDDVSYTYTPYALPNINAALTSMSAPSGLTGQSKIASATVRNLGVSPITSFDLKLEYNNTTQIKNVTSVNVISLASLDVNFDQPILLAAGNNVAKVTVMNVNNVMNDGDSTDNEKTTSINPVTPAMGKVVVAEEGTGTWCQWCPRGAVFMDKMSHNYDGYFAGIAVHNADPMTYTMYDDGISAMIPGYPSVVMGRDQIIDPSDIEADFLNKVAVAPIAFLENGATYNSTTRELKVSVTTTFNQAIAGDYKMTCVLTEDSVKGTGSGYSQSNAYSGGTNGVMGGYELLANPVPFTKMVYDHVARIICPSFEGYANAFGANVDSGVATTHTYTYVLPANWKTEKMHIINMVLNPSGVVENATTTTIAEAVTNGFKPGLEIGTNVVGIQTLSGPDDMKLIPNPANNQANISFTLTNESDITVAVYAVDGRLIASRNYGKLAGANSIPMDVSGFTKGIYFVKVNTDNGSSTLRLIKE